MKHLDGCLAVSELAAAAEGRVASRAWIVSSCQLEHACELLR